MAASNRALTLNGSGCLFSLLFITNFFLGWLVLGFWGWLALGAVLLALLLASNFLAARVFFSGRADEDLRPREGIIDVEFEREQVDPGSLPEEKDT